MTDTGELDLRGLREIGQPFHRGHSRPAFESGGERLAQHPCTRGVGGPYRGGQTRHPGGIAADEDDRRLTGAQREGRRAHRLGVDSGRDRRGQSGRRLRAVGPRHVGGQDQRGHRSGPTGGDRVDRIRGDIGRAGAAPHPARHGAGQCVDVGFQWGVVALVIGGVISDDHHHRHMRAPRVVQVGQAVTQPRTQMQQDGGGFVGHPGVAIGRAGGHALEQGQHTAHRGDGVQRRDEMHLRGPRIGEADIDATVDESSDEGLRTVHDRHSFSVGNTRSALACR